MKTGAQILWECLVREGVTDVFGYPGGAILPAYDAMLEYPIRHVLVRHEQGATHMADGYARASGRVGVAVATSGPGATNMVTGIATAMLDSSPIASANCRRSFARWDGRNPAQCRKALAAAETASSTSLGPQRATRAHSRPVNGS